MMMMGWLGKLDDRLKVLIERRNWLTARIAAKQSVHWEVQWDIRERDALAWAVRILTHPVVRFVTRLLAAA